MKDKIRVTLSEKASERLLELYALSNEQGNITHFLNKLITQFPIKEDKPYDETKPIHS